MNFLKKYITRSIWLSAVLILLCPRLWAGELTPYTDPNQFTKVPFGDYSHWAQPWRAYLETMPATTFLNGTGINYQGNGNPDLEVQHLAKHGIAHIRIEVGWGNLEYADETKISNSTQLTAILTACRKYGVRPLILLNANSGAPCPLQMFSRTALTNAAAGQNTIQLNSTSGLIVGYSGLSNLTGYCAAQDLITSINGNTVTLSQPLQVAIASGATVSMATLKYRPFCDPVGDPTDYNATLAGWESYVKVVGTFVANAMATGNPNDAGFDMEVWNELTFDSQYLSIDNYVKPVTDVYNERTLWATLPAVTAQVAAQNPTVFAGVLIGDGFANTVPWPASSTEPLGISAIDKHPYQGRKTFPMSAPGQPLNALFQTDTSGYQPSYTELFPEYFGTTIQTETMIRDMGPFTTNFGGALHGRDARTPPVTAWVTEVNIAPDQDNPAVDAQTALYLKAKTTARYFCFYLNKGVTLMTLYNDCAGDRDLGLVSDAFLALTKTPGAVYPANDASLTSPALQVTGNIAQAMQTDLDTTLTPATTRQLTLQSISDTHDNIQFAGDGTAAHPDLYDRDVFAFLPFQVNANRFVIPYYVMTRDIAHVYDAAQTEGHQYDMPQEAFTLTIGGLKPLQSVTVYDPMTNQAVPVTVVSSTSTSTVIQVEATDAPRLLVIQEKKTLGPPPSVPSGLAATAGNSLVTLSWPAVTGATSYNLYKATASGAEGSTPFVTGLTKAGYKDTKVTDGTTYYYQVTAVGASESAPSNEAHATPLGPPVVTVPASASPQTVTGTTTNLSVQGQDPQGERLSYTWSAQGPADVVFSINDASVAAQTMATFSTPGAYTITVTITDTSGLSVTSSIPVTVVAPPAAPAAMAIDSGGGTTGVFAADAAFSGGTTSATAAAISTSGVANAAPQAVYQTERVGNFVYTLTGLTPGTAYTLKLHFAELTWNSPKQRLFNVGVNGVRVLTRFDIFAAAGGKDKAIVETFTVKANAQGKIKVRFHSIRDNAKVSGIALTR
jgi:hypothetical protein